MVKVVLILALLYVANSCARNVDTRHFYDVTTSPRQQLIVDEDYPVEYQIYLFDKHFQAGSGPGASQEMRYVKKKKSGTKTRCVGSVTTMALCF